MFEKKMKVLVVAVDAGCKFNIRFFFLPEKSQYSALPSELLNERIARNFCRAHRDDRDPPEDQKSIIGVENYHK